MIKKRIIAVVSISDGIVVQSFSYNNKLPLGRPEAFIKNLDRWMVDEILVNDFSRSKNNKSPDYDLIKRIGRISKNTPIIYSGGVKTANEASRIINYGFERIAFDSLYHSSPKEFELIAKMIGSQAIIINLPLCIKHKKLYHYNYINKNSEEFNVDKIFKYRDFFSELMLTDYKNEGTKKGFNYEIISQFCKLNNKFKIIAFGGISENTQVQKIIKNNDITAVCVGNFLNYREISYQSLKEFLVLKKIKSIRPPNYKKLFSDE